MSYWRVETSLNERRVVQHGCNRWRHHSMSAAWCNTGTFDSMRASVHEAQTITDVPIPYLELDFKQSFWTFIFHKLSYISQTISSSREYNQKYKILEKTQKTNSNTKQLTTDKQTKTQHCRTELRKYITVDIHRHRLWKIERRRRSSAVVTGRRVSGVRLKETDRRVTSAQLNLTH